MPSPTPIRAWAEYENWSPYLYPTLSGEWSSVCIPKTGEESHVVAHGFARTLPDWFRIQGKEFGPLRSLRVLLSGHDGRLRLYRNTRAGREIVGGEWIDLPAGARTWHLYDGKGAELRAGWIEPVATDADAVTRALAAAVAWVAGEEVQP